MAAEGGDELIGVSRQQASRLGRLSIQRLYAWEERGLIVPAMGDAQRDAPRHRLYRFDQLVEIVVVRQIEDRGVDIQQLQHFVNRLRDTNRIARPLGELRWGVLPAAAPQSAAGRRRRGRGRVELFVQFEDGQWLGDRRPAQGVMLDLLDVEQIRIDLRAQLSERLGTPGQIEQRRGVRHHQEVFQGTRIPVRAVLAFIERGHDDERILAAYPDLTTADVAMARSLASATA